MSNWQNFQVKRAVKVHACAGTMDGKLAFYLTPAQARLVWWGMRCFGSAVRDSVAACQPGKDYADDLRCHADADEWSRDFMARLAIHAEKDGPSIIQEGVACL